MTRRIRHPKGRGQRAKFARADRAFKLAMLAARASGEEHFALGVVDTAGTHCPRRMLGYRLGSLGQSVAGELADWGDKGGFGPNA